MSILGAGSAVVSAGKTLTNDKSFSSLANLVKAVGSLGDVASPSLTRYANNTVITSPAFIDRTLVDEDVMVPMMGMLNQILCGFVLTALNLDRMTTEGRTVRELLKAVSTESFVDVIEVIDGQFGSVESYLNAPVVGIEANMVDLDPASQKLFSGRVIEVKFSATASLSHREVTSQLNTTHKGGRTETETGGTRTDTSTREYHVDDEGNRHPVYENGKPVFNVNEQEDEKIDKTKTVSGSKDQTVQSGEKSGSKQQLNEMSVYLYVQILPRLLDPEAVKGFVTLNFDPTWSQRWKQMRAGEIAFWKDFIFAKDLLQKHSSVLKADKSGAIAEMLTKQRNKLAQHIWSSLTDDIARHNLANSIVIVSKKNFDAACSETGVDFDRMSDRTAYFNKTYSMFLVVVDNMYGTVDLYMNGISNVGSYSFNMINKSARGKDSFDLKDMMTVMAQGQAPRF